MSTISTLKDLYLRQLHELLHAERSSLPVLAAMAEAAADSMLRAVFEEQVEETRKHAARLERLLEDSDENLLEGTGEAVEGLLRQAEEVLNETALSEVRDAALIAAAQRLEHYEIAGYGCVSTYAALLHEEEAAEVLQEILDQEVDADLRLTEMAENLNLPQPGVCATATA
jgi:ferritin-like metal-binding protein YciE